jgi:hypothetical protein
VAYRSRPRPSSALCAKASTTCPYYLDGDLESIYMRLGDYPLTRSLIEERVSVATVQFSRAVREGGIALQHGG